MPGVDPANVKVPSPHPCRTGVGPEKVPAFGIGEPHSLYIWAERRYTDISHFGVVRL